MAESTPDTADTVDPSPGAVVAPQETAEPEPTPASDPTAPDDASSTATETAAAPEPAVATPNVEVDPPETSPLPSTRELPDYTRNLLKISVPVMVTLAEKRQPLGQVVELSPGAIIQFDKSCEQMLDLSVAGHKVAAGEAVKVGDKFGLKITSVVLPDERFKTVRPKPKS